jgi:hypothetical protein
VALAAEVGYPVALKLSGAHLQHKSEAGALALELADEPALLAAFERLAALAVAEGATFLVEEMAAPGVELVVAARADGVVPALVVGVGGIWTEALDDVAVIPLPASPERVEAALRALRASAVLEAARGGVPADIAAAAALASRAGEALLEHGLSLLELNPVVVGSASAVALDAVARR